MPSDWHLETLTQPYGSHNLGPCLALVRVLGQTQNIQGAWTNHVLILELSLGICGTIGFHEGTEMGTNCTHTDRGEGG